MVRQRSAKPLSPVQIRMPPPSEECYLRKTRIICTIGPSSADPAILEKLMLNGMDIARINTSHSSMEDALAKINLIRDIEKRNKIDTGILLDLQGQKYGSENLMMTSS